MESTITPHQQQMLKKLLDTRRANKGKFRDASLNFEAMPSAQHFEELHAAMLAYQEATADLDAYRLGLGLETTSC